MSEKPQARLWAAGKTKLYIYIYIYLSIYTETLQFTAVAVFMFNKTRLYPRMINTISEAVITYSIHRRIQHTDTAAN